MRVPLQVSFHNLARSDAIAARIRGLAARLDRHCDGVISCRVTVEALDKRRRHGNHYNVRIGLTVPGGALVANRESDENRGGNDVYAAIGDAFDAIRRQLDAYAQRRWHGARVEAARAPSSLAQPPSGS